MPFIEERERERVSRIIGERCRSGPRNVPESNLGRSDPQQTSEGAHIQKSQHIIGLSICLMSSYLYEKKRLIHRSTYTKKKGLYCAFHYSYLSPMREFLRALVLDLGQDTTI